MPFLRRHSVPVAIALFGLVMAYLLSDLFAGFQVGIGPEFILKSFAKLFYLAVAWIASKITAARMYTLGKWMPAACYWRADVVEALQYTVGPTDGTAWNGWRWHELSSHTHG